MHALKYINAGANGFLSKLSEEEEIKKAIIKMKEDGEYISPATQALLMNSLRDRKVINPLFWSYRKRVTNCGTLQQRTRKPRNRKSSGS